MLDTITTVSRQWASRPDDERFLSLTDLLAEVSRQRANSTAKVASNRRLLATPGDDHKALYIESDTGIATPTNWAFNQLASLAGGPAGYLRKLPSDLVADCINYGLRFNRDVEEVGLLSTVEGDGRIDLRAATGPNYGRIWNEDIVRALIDKFGDGTGRDGPWKVPGEFGRNVPITKSNTTIYGGDRNIFAFLADEQNRIETADRRPGEPGSFARGFYVWNSEVGAEAIGAAFFLFDYVCMNRIIWGVKEFREVRLRHTSGAPDRWLEQIVPVLASYSEASAKPVEETIAAAAAKKLDDVDAFLKQRFSRGRAEDIKQAHVREENRPIETVWDAVTGVTAFAKTIPHQDDRVAIERIGGQILDLVAVK